MLSHVVVGNPANPDVTLGALASLGQREEVRRAVAALGTDAELIVGDPEKVEVADADPQVGAFLSPLVLRARAALAPAPHEIEAFGPVTTLIPYGGPDELVTAAALGQGSLVGSIVTGDQQFALDLIGRLAPWHGRLLVLDTRDAATSTGHGVAMPQLLHGGPGRAGGGEELGGLRALNRYLQRTAVQGHPDLLAALVPDPVAG